MAQTSIHIEPCNIGSSERHNLRSKELDYIRPELTHLNESWTGQEIATCMENAKRRYRESTGQNMQKKATPIREGVAVIRQDTTMQELRNFADRVQNQWGIKTIQIHLHKDEGYAPAGKSGEWKPNLHAHMIFDWTNEAGKSYKLNRQDMAKMQTMLAECLGMERGVSSDRAHLNAIQYKAMKEAERLMEIERQLPELENEQRNALVECEKVSEHLETAKQELRKTKNDIRKEKVREAAAKAGKAIFEATERLFSSRAINSMQKEIEALRSENRAVKQDATLRINRAQNKLNETRREMEKEISALKEDCDAVRHYFPTMTNAGRNVRQLRKMGIPDEQIPDLLLGRKLAYSGPLYDTEHRHTHQVDGVSVQIAGATGREMHVRLDRQTVTDFFRSLWTALQQRMSRNRNGGMHM